jgi:hypothetical protein
MRRLAINPELTPLLFQHRDRWLCQVRLSNPSNMVWDHVDNTVGDVFYDIERITFNLCKSL